VGLCGVPGGILDKPGPLNDSEWERIRLHAYYTERIVERCTALARAAEIASMAHERLDGSGYHRRLPRAAVTVLGRVLAAADAYRSMTEPRAHRPARTAEEAAAELRKEVAEGKLERESVEAVLAAAGQTPQRRVRSDYPNGLTEREVEILRHVARGLTNKEVAQKLDLSARTVGNHLQSVYTKAGVTTRAGATLFAMQNDMLWDPVRD
jgi:HD-GYP domain-containing protein (c-di-GMP phosphodiesterase class II)